MNVQVWDGKKFKLMTRDAAKELVDAGSHEISTGKNANDLLSYSRLQARKKEIAAAKRKTSTEYKTREMRAEKGTPDGPTGSVSKPKKTSRRKG